MKFFLPLLTLVTCVLATTNQEQDVASDITSTSSSVTKLPSNSTSPFIQQQEAISTFATSKKKTVSSTSKKAASFTSKKAVSSKSQTLSSSTSAKTTKSASTKISTTTSKKHSTTTASTTTPHVTTAATVAGTSVSAAALVAVDCTPQTVCADAINACGWRYGGCFNVCNGPFTAQFTPPPCATSSVAALQSAEARIGGSVAVRNIGASGDVEGQSGTGPTTYAVVVEGVTTAVWGRRARRM